MTFEEDTDDYFARQIVFERMAQATLPTGVTPSLAPLFSPSGLVYRYVIESPDRSPLDILAFSPDGGRLAAATMNRLIQLWNLALLRDGLAELKLERGWPASP